MSELQSKEYVNVTPAGLPLKRISWSAVFAGVIAGLIVHVFLGVLGTAIGASVIDPQQEQNPLNHMGTGVLMWAGLSMLLAIGIGSYIAGRFAHREGALHGLLMFGVSTLLTLWLAFSVASGIIGGAFTVLGASAKAVGNGISAVSLPAGNLVKEKFQENNINLDALNKELQTTLRQTGKPELQPEKLRQDVSKEARAVKDQAADVSKKSPNTESDITGWINSVIHRHADTLQAVDRDALKNIIKAHTGKNDQEADQIVNQAAQSYQNAVAQYQELKQQAEEKARAAADKAAAATAKASWFTFLMLLIEGILAAVAGEFGRRTQPHHVLTHKNQL